MIAPRLNRALDAIGSRAHRNTTASNAEASRTATAAGAVNDAPDGDEGLSIRGISCPPCAPRAGVRQSAHRLREDAGLPEMLEHPGRNRLNRDVAGLQSNPAIVLERQRDRIAITDLQLLADLRRQHKSATVGHSHVVTGIGLYSGTSPYTGAVSRTRTPRGLGILYCAMSAGYHRQPSAGKATCTIPTGSSYFPQTGCDGISELRAGDSAGDMTGRCIPRAGESGGCSRTARGRAPSSPRSG